MCMLQTSTQQISFISDSGGGGERVLWFMILALLNNSELFKNNVYIAVYSGEISKSKVEILDNVKV